MTREEYVKLQDMWLNATGVKEGSWVKVTRKADDNESGWGAQWVNVMTDVIGKVCRVIGIHSSLGLHLESLEDGRRYGFPFFVLEPAEAPKPEKYRFQPFERVLVRDCDKDPWRINLFSKYNKGYIYPFEGMGSTWKQCIPYAGHEALLGTTDEPEDWARYYDKE